MSRFSRFQLPIGSMGVKKSARPVNSMFILRFTLLLAELTPSSPFLCCATHPRVWPCCSRQYCNFAYVETCGSRRAPHSFFITAFLLTQDQQGEVSVMMSLTRFKDWAAAWTASIASHHAWTKSSLLPRDWQWSGDFLPQKIFPSHHHPGETKKICWPSPQTAFPPVRTCSVGLVSVSFGRVARDFV